MGSLCCTSKCKSSEYSNNSFVVLTFCNSYALPRANLIYNSLVSVGPTLYLKCDRPCIVTVRLGDDSGHGSVNPTLSLLLVSKGVQITWTLIRLDARID